MKKPVDAVGPEKDECIEDAMDKEEPGNERQATMKHSKKANNYLDEVLSQRKEKKHKATKKKEKEGK